MTSRGFARGRLAARGLCFAFFPKNSSQVRLQAAGAMVAAGLLVTPVTAAEPGAGDTPDYVAEEFSWTGLYFGGHIGYGWADWDGTLETTAGCPSSCVVNASFSMPDRMIDGEGVFGGLQAGANWQFPNMFVLGVEADVSLSDIEGTATFDTDLDGPNVWSKRHDFSLDYFGTVRGRIGYAMGRVLPYVTGGLVWGHTSADLGVTFIQNGVTPIGTSYASADEMHLGWAIGAGAEVALGKNWTLKAEYLFMDLGKQDYLFEGSTFVDTPFDTDSFPSNLTVGTVKVGINYLYN